MADARGAQVKRKEAQERAPSGNLHKIGAVLLLLLMALAIGYLTYTVLFAGAGSGQTSAEEPQQRSRVEVGSLRSEPVVSQASVQQVAAQQPEPQPEPPAEPPAEPSLQAAPKPNELAPDPKPSELPLEPKPSQPPPENGPLGTPNEPKTPAATPQEPAPSLNELPPEPAPTKPAPEEPEAWRSFKATFNRTYPTAEEEARRRAVFEENLHLIETHNARNESYRLAVNYLADLTRAEINDLVLGPPASWAQTIGQLTEPIPPPLRILSEAGEQPGAVDWRWALGEPTSSHVCRASAVFAAVSNVEAILNAASPQMPPQKLSEVQLINCLNQSADRPSVCNGQVNMVHVYEALRRLEGGLATARAFAEISAAVPRELLCALPPGDQLRAKLAGLAYVHRNNFLEALNSGPLTVALDASQSTFHFYGSGLYQDPLCSAATYNLHALLVGAAPDALTVRTSLGPDWGERGHLRLARRDDNRCLPQEMAIQPQLQLH